MDMIYKHIPSGMFLILVTKRKSNINTYIECDELGVVININRPWMIGKYKVSPQCRIVTGFKNLKLISNEH